MHIFIGSSIWLIEEPIICKYIAELHLKQDVNLLLSEGKSIACRGQQGLLIHIIKEITENKWHGSL